MMKKTIPLMILLTGVLLAAFVSCSRTTPLEKSIKQALVQQDTTQARFDSLCSIITASPDRYKAYLTEGGEVNVEALGNLIEQIGSGLRPPMHWDVARYGLRQLSLTIYFERSGSMVPYDAPGGRGQLKKAVNDLINFFPTGGQTTINIVNDDIYPYKGSIDAFLQDRDIYASTQGVGDAAFTDFQKIFTRVLQAQQPGNVSVLVSDLIYSPADTRDVSLEKIFNEENSLATSIFKQYKGKSIIVHQLMGDYSGKYYPYNGQPVNYRGQRPFYLVVVADSKVMNAMAADAAFAQFMHPAGAVNSYRFNQAEQGVDYCVVPDWKENAGRFRIDHRDPSHLTKCDGDKTTGVLCLSVAANLGGLQKDARFLADAKNYQVKSMSGFALKVTPITPDMITGNNKAYLEGKTHLLTFTGEMQGPRDELTVSIANEFPAWIARSSATTDVNPSAPDFATTTLGLKELLSGIASAFGTGGNYTTITLKLEK
ncbi:MAG: hypothetical protein IJT30_08235 [Muribaculaceae bacterium]|nr:hypothetical protein [Muribaculaceae bacterium]